MNDDMRKAMDDNAKAMLRHLAIAAEQRAGRRPLTVSELSKAMSINRPDFPAALRDAGVSFLP
jgi:hypothetical protein